MMRIKFTFLALLFFVFFQSKDFFRTIQNKTISGAPSLVIFYRPDCPYCLKLDEEMNINTSLSNQIKNKFNVSIVDITTAEGSRIASFYGVDKVPTLVKYDRKNKNFENIVGYFKADILKNKLFNGLHEKVNSKYSKKAAAYCGDGFVDAGEGCDDGNTVNGDGCSNICTVQSGWKCVGSPSVCSINSVCGNGIVEIGEGCDDGNTVNGDGCSNICTVQSGWKCVGSPSVCNINSVCGNGIVEIGEGCDDGNTVNGDGCSNMCTVQSGWSCSGSPSVCSNTLGVDDISKEGIFNLIIGPNPISEKISIQFFLSKKNIVEVGILDNTGRQVYQAKNRNLIIGNNQLDIHLKNKLSSGIYYLNLKFENDGNYKLVSKKIIIK